MTSRLLHWYGARTAGGVFAVLIAVGLAVLLSPGGLSWWGGYSTALDWANGAALLMGPAAAGIAATQYARSRLPGWCVVLDGSVRGYRGWAEPALLVWLLAVAAVLVLSGGTLTMTRLLGGGGHVHSGWLVLTTASVLLAQVSLGAMIGTALGRLWAGPVAAIGIYALSVLGVFGIIPNLFDVGPAGEILVGMTYSASYLAQQSLACLAITGLALLVVQRRLAPAITMRTGGLACLVLAGAAAAGLGLDGQRYVAATTAPALTCAGAQPVVCLADDSSRPLASLAAEMHRQAEALRRIGVTLPDRWVQSMSGFRFAYPHAGSISFAGADEAAATVDPRVASMSLATPTQCRQFFSNGPAVDAQRALLASYVLADWIATAGDVATTGQLGLPREDVWLARRSPAQERWVRSTYQQLKTCDLASIRLPF